jgi:hypothetical protein
MDDVLARLRVPQVEVLPHEALARRRSSGHVVGKFLRGPIPLAWLGRACRLRGGKVVATALAIWFLAGLRRREWDLKLTSDTLTHFGVTDRAAKYRALKALEEAGLIQVERRPNKNPLVTILGAGKDAGANPAA